MTLTPLIDRIQSLHDSVLIYTHYTITHRSLTSLPLLSTGARQQSIQSQSDFAKNNAHTIRHSCITLSSLRRDLDTRHCITDLTDTVKYCSLSCSYPIVIIITPDLRREEAL